VYESDDAIKLMLVFGEMLLGATFASTLVCWDVGSTEVLRTIPLTGDPVAIVHPDTYLNKVVIVYEKGIQLLNVKTTARLCDFPNIIAALSG
jgi:hypothetical protein